MRNLIGLECSNCGLCRELPHHAPILYEKVRADGLFQTNAPSDGKGGHMLGRERFRTAKYFQTSTTSNVSDTAVTTHHATR
jgi:hypothetical protein